MVWSHTHLARQSLSLARSLSGNGIEFQAQLATLCTELSTLLTTLALAFDILCSLHLAIRLIAALGRIGITAGLGCIFVVLAAALAFALLGRRLLALLTLLVFALGVFLVLTRLHLVRRLVAVGLGSARGAAAIGVTRGTGHRDGAGW
jgi:hypothetical protein